MLNSPPLDILCFLPEVIYEEKNMLKKKQQLSSVFLLCALRFNQIPPIILQSMLALIHNILSF